MLIQMVQQLSGRRADGRFWPQPGGTLDVSPEEARELTATDSHQSHPIAILVREAPVEDARADVSTVETSAPVQAPVRETAPPAEAPAETAPVGTKRARPAPRPAPVMEKRG
jgi:hypothetical protein